MGNRVCMTRSLGIFAGICLLMLVFGGCDKLSSGYSLANRIDSSPEYVGQSTDNNYDRDSREPTRESEVKANAHAISLSVDRFAADHPPGSEAQDSPNIINTTLADSGMAETIESWFIPKAYADDHEIDERYLIRDGECSLQAESYKDAAGKVEGIAKLYNGMVADSHSQKLHDESVEGWLKLRIPTENFFDAWRDVREIGEVLEESVSTKDVSQTYVGYVSKLKNLMAEQAVLTEMLDEALAVQRSRGLGEGYSILLDTQERLFKVTGEIESTEDRMGALADQITRSTITVRITEIKKLPEQLKQQFSWGFGETAGGAFKDLQYALRNTAQGIIYFLITCWTWLIPWAIVFFIGRWAYRKYVVPHLKDGKLKQAVSTPKGDFKPKG